MKNYIPFSNGTEAQIWMSRNCEVCTTKCHFKKNIEFGFISGSITQRTAEFIGIQKIYASVPIHCTLNDICQYKDKFIKPAKKKPENLKENTNLFSGLK